MKVKQEISKTKRRVENITRKNQKSRTILKRAICITPESHMVGVKNIAEINLMNVHQKRAIENQRVRTIWETEITIDQATRRVDHTKRIFKLEKIIMNPILAISERRKSLKVQNRKVISMMK